MLRVSVLVGNPKPLSRTKMIAERLVEQCFRADTYEMNVVDLADFAGQMFDWPSATMSELSERVSGSNFLVVATPTYKGSPTGLLKAFLDRYPANGLAGVVAIPLMTGADRTHWMAPRLSLIPILLELGAVVPFGAFYFVTSDMHNLENFLAEGGRSITRSTASILDVAAALQQNS